MNYKVIEFHYDRYLSKVRRIRVNNCNGLIDLLGKLVENGNYYISNKEELKEVLSNYFEKDIKDIEDKDVLEFIENEMYGDGESFIEYIENENKEVIYNNNENNDNYENYEGEWYKDNYDEEGYKELLKDIEEEIILD